MKSLFPFLFILLTPAWLAAATVEMTSGRVFEGEIIEQTDDYIRLRTDQQTLKIRKRLIKSGVPARPRTGQASTASAHVPAISSLLHRKESAFLTELNYTEYPEAPPPAEPQTFRWGFSSPSTSIYSYDNQTQNHSTIGIDQKTKGAETQLTKSGSLVIRSQGQGTAQLSLRVITGTAKIQSLDGGPAQEKPHPQEPSVIKTLNEDGSGNFGTTNQDLFLKTILSLPNGPLSVGDSAETPVSVHVNNGGTLLMGSGTATVTLARYVKLGTRTCAQFNIVTNIADAQIPQNFQGDFMLSVKGKAVCYFDVEKGVLVSGTSALLFKTNVKNPEIGIQVSSTQDYLEKIHLN